MSTPVQIPERLGHAGALFDPTRTYRYLLWRRWGDGPLALWIMLNPSTADESLLDPTLRRVAGFTRRQGAAGFVVANAYALRSTDPKVLWLADDPVGPDNDRVIRHVASRAHTVVVGWGTNAKPDRVAEVAAMLNVPLCLGVTKSGAPRHPLYIRKDEPLVPWRPSTLGGGR